MTTISGSAARHLVALCLLLPALASAEIDHLLKLNESPDGVVFEVVESDEDALTWAVPRIREYVARLRERFPELDMAVVTHGREEFALQTTERDNFGEIHAGVVSLLQDDGVQTHVCGTHASWFGVTEEDFPDYVDVVPQGPTQLRLYEELGWEVVRLEGPDD